MVNQNARRGQFDDFLIAAAEAALGDPRGAKAIYGEVFQLFFGQYTTEQAIKLATLVHALRDALTFTVERNIEDRARCTSLRDLSPESVSKDGKIEPTALANAFKAGQQSGRERRSLREALGDDLRPENLLHEAVEALREDGRSESKVLDELNIQELWVIESLGNQAREIIGSRTAEE